MKGERWCDVRKWKKIHFKQRLKERYGIWCNRFDIKELNHIVSTCRYIDSIKQSNTRLKVLLAFMGEIVYIIYDTYHKTPCTALPLESYVHEFRINKE